MLLFNVMVYYILMIECVIIIEDMVELLFNYLYVVCLESWLGGFEGMGVVMIWELLCNSLCMWFDCIIVGEVCGGEVLEMF